jgi:hypothetical protein
MNILLGDFSDKVSKEGIFKQIIQNETLYKFNNDNEIRVVNFATLKKSGCQNYMFLHVTFIYLFGLLPMERSTIKLIIF